MLYEMKEWSEHLDLSEFYSEAERRGHVNNLSQKVMVDCFRNEDKAQVWILYKNSKPIGSVAAHSFPEMGDNAYRILTRTCVLDGVIPNNGKGLGTGRWYIQQHQNITCQYYVPKMIEWCGPNSKMYATSNELDGGSQKKVHSIYFPLLERQGEWKRGPVINYRGCTQQVWELNAQQFLDNLDKYGRWN